MNVVSQIDATICNKLCKTGIPPLIEVSPRSFLLLAIASARKNTLVRQSALAK
jgi:hypothetical protein